MILLQEQGVEIPGPVGTPLRAQERHPHDVREDRFQRLAVLFIYAQQKGGEHDEHHHHRRRRGSHRTFQKKENRNADQRAGSEADKLPLG